MSESGLSEQLNGDRNPSTSPLSQSYSTEKDIQAVTPKPKSKSSMQRWSALAGLLLLLGGLGFGWRWWQASQAGARQGAPGGMSMAVPVKLAAAKTSQVIESSEFVGALESPNSVVLRPEITGRVSGILVKSGDRVSPGDPLIQLRPDKREADLSVALAGSNSAQANRANAASQIAALQAERAANDAEVRLQDEEYKRIEVLVREGALPQQRLDQVIRDRNRAVAQLTAIDQRIEAAKAGLAAAEAGLQQAQASVDRASEDLQDATVFAPFNGTVGDIPVKIGQIVGTSDTLTTVTQNQSLELKLQIPLERAPGLKLGQRVELLDNQSNLIATGRISFVSARADINAQSVLAKATFDNPRGQLRDGQFVRARVIWQQQPGVLVPTSAISRLGGETFVFLAQAPDPAAAESAPSPAPQAPGAGAPPDMVAKQQLVKLGQIQGNEYQVLEGLKPGDEYVVSGVLNLREGIPIMPLPLGQEGNPAGAN